MIYLENEYIKIDILPEIGGRYGVLWIKQINTILFIASM